MSTFPLLLWRLLFGSHTSSQPQWYLLGHKVFRTHSISVRNSTQRRLAEGWGSLVTGGKHSLWDHTKGWVTASFSGGNHSFPWLCTEEHNLLENFKKKGFHGQIRLKSMHTWPLLYFFFFIQHFLNVFNQRYYFLSSLPLEIFYRIHLREFIFAWSLPSACIVR